MSVYNKTVASITTGDLQELLTDGPVENVRLEFKSTVPSRDEFLKRASGFANLHPLVEFIQRAYPCGIGYHRGRERLVQDVIELWCGVVSSQRFESFR